MKKTLQLEPISKWPPTASKPIIISGPCSAETEEQTIATAKQLAATGKVHALRAGIWKPRTRPGQYEGAGEEGLKWLIAAKKETGLPVTTEVANAAHVEACLKAGVNILWVGARTTVNPFSVQEVADSLKGVDIPVMVKNPINPDLELWIGALERLNKAGLTKLAAIHRGFSSFEKGPFRNAPMWDMAIELKTRIPELTSSATRCHISGNRELISFISQKALDLDMAGLMIESHINPDAAWSDAKQQVTPANLGKIIDGLVVRTVSSDNKTFQGYPQHFARADRPARRRDHVENGGRMKISREDRSIQKRERRYHPASGTLGGDHPNPHHAGQGHGLECRLHRRPAEAHSPRVHPDPDQGHEQGGRTRVTTLLRSAF